jgi:hypothetical protein
MIAIGGQVSRLAVLVLLFSGLLQSLVSAQGITCARTHSAAQVAQQPVGPAVEGPVSASGGQHLLALEHEHSSIPQPDAAGALSASCGVVAVLPAERRLLSPAAKVRHLLPPSELPRASLLVRSFFRPPRLS